jgi:predicted RNA-binding Zn-ribbon protein involved in translation (DUF1610 family)
VSRQIRVGVAGLHAPPAPGRRLDLFVVRRCPFCGHPHVHRAAAERLRAGVERRCPQTGLRYTIRVGRPA